MFAYDDLPPALRVSGNQGSGPNSRYASYYYLPVTFVIAVNVSTGCEHNFTMGGRAACEEGEQRNLVDSCVRLMTRVVLQAHARCIVISSSRNFQFHLTAAFVV